MRFFISLFIMVSFNYSEASVNLQNCKAESPTDQFIYSDDFQWDYDLAGLRLKSQEIYLSPKRLKKRAFINSKGEIFLPYDESHGGPIQISQSFVEQVAAHIEQGFRKNIVDAVFFPDMGHSHLFIPQKKYESYYSKFESDQFSQFYQKLFEDADLKILYHTAEQLKFRGDDGELIPDTETVHRYQTRNLIGPNDNSSIFIIQNPDSPANTARDLPGHFYWGAGFNLSANQNGCFSFLKNGQTFFFDLSMYDLESSGSGGDF